MTNLTQAIAELRQMELTYGQLWTAREVMQTKNIGDCKTIATILNAVLSGELIPLADHKMAVAEAYRKAADFVKGHGTVSRGAISPLSEHSDPPLTKVGAVAVNAENAKLRADADRFDLIAAAISALAPDDALAEVQALRAVGASVKQHWLDKLNAEARAEAAEAELAARVCAMLEVEEARGLA